MSGTSKRSKKPKSKPCVGRYNYEANKRIKKERHHKYLEKQTTNKDIRLELINDVCIHTGLTKAALKRMIGTLNIRRLIQVKNDIHSFQPWFLNRIKRPKHGINSQNS